MTPRTRRRMFWVAGSVLAVLLGWGLSGLPAFGHAGPSVGDRLDRIAVGQRRATDVVTSVVFDYRGFDTLGEEFILFAAVSGVALLLRPQREERHGSPGPTAERSRSAPPGRAALSRAVRTFGLWLIGPTVLFGLSLVTHGHLTPGGGFQGGSVLATASISIWLVGGYRRFRRVNPIRLIDAGEGAGAAGFALVGALGILSGAAFLSNVLPLGTPGHLLSAGTIPVLNLAAGLEVAAGFVLMLSEFLEQSELDRRARR